MKNQFVPYKLALKLKELGFNETCLGYYSDKDFYIHNSKSRNYNHLEAPLWQQAFDWFRIKKNLHVVIYQSNKCQNNPNWEWGYNISKIEEPNGSVIHKWYFNTFEEARQACLEKLIELCKKN